MFLEYGVNESNRYIHISQVTSGRVPLSCPYCGQGLIARKGTQKEHHFAHDGNTCRESQRDFEALNIPYFDRFNMYIDGKTWERLQAFHKDKSYARMLADTDYVNYNTWGREAFYELSDLGKIPFGLATLSKFSECQIDKIMSQHYELSETIKLAQFGNLRPGYTDWYLIEPNPDMVIPALADLNIFRSQIARVFALDLYLLKITTDKDTLYKIGVTSDIDRRISEIKRDLSAHMPIKKIEVDRLLARRGAVERYALHRYKDYRVSIGKLTEYFQFDKKTLSQVRRDFTSLGDFWTTEGDDHYITNWQGITTDDNGLPRLHQRGLISTILEEQPPQIEALVKDTIHRENIRQGTIAGMQRAKEAGIHVGRPAEDDQSILDKYPNVVECIKNGVSLRKAAVKCGVSVNTVRKVKEIINK